MKSPIAFGAVYIVMSECLWVMIMCLYSAHAGIMKPPYTDLALNETVPTSLLGLNSGLFISSADLNTVLKASRLACSAT
jgi:hypothetical protein